ncbi:MAG: hypothetical protein AB1489_06675 [Acidobacteriota bacterium]
MQKLFGVFIAVLGLFVINAAAQMHEADNNTGIVLTLRITQDEFAPFEPIPLQTELSNNTKELIRGTPWLIFEVVESTSLLRIVKNTHAAISAIDNGTIRYLKI